jgi:tRNA(fMet)-specific endonuclease VapC
LTVVPFKREEALITGRLRAVLDRAGTPIGHFDVLIAGTALMHDLTLVSANTKEFARVPNLRLENWREPYEVQENTFAHAYIAGRSDRSGAAAL